MLHIDTKMETENGSEYFLKVYLKRLGSIENY